MPNLTVQEYLISRGLHLFGGHANHPVISREEATIAGCSTDTASMAACPLVETIRVDGRVYYSLIPVAYDDRETVDIEMAEAEYVQGVINLAKGIVEYVLRVVQTGVGLDKVKSAASGDPKALVGALYRAGPYLPWCTRASPGLLPRADIVRTLLAGGPGAREFVERDGRNSSRVDPRHWRQIDARDWSREAAQKYRFNALVYNGRSTEITTWDEGGARTTFLAPNALAIACGETSTFSEAVQVIAAFWRASTNVIGTSRSPDPRPLKNPPSDLRPAMRLRKYDLLFSVSYTGGIYRFVSETPSERRASLPGLGRITNNTPAWVVWVAVHAQYKLAWNAGQVGLIHPDSLTDSDRALISTWVSGQTLPTRPEFADDAFLRHRSVIDVTTPASTDSVGLVDVVRILGLELPAAPVEDPSAVVSMADVQRAQAVSSLEGAADEAPAPEVPSDATTSTELASSTPSWSGAATADHDQSEIKLLPEASFPFRDLAPRRWARDEDVEPALPFIARILRHPTFYTFCATLGVIPEQLARLSKSVASGTSAMLVQALDHHVLFQNGRNYGDHDVFVGFHKPVGPAGAILHAGSIFRYNRGSDEYEEHPIVWLTDRSGVPGDYAYAEDGHYFNPVEDEPFAAPGDDGWWARAIATVLSKHEVSPGSLLGLGNNAHFNGKDGLSQLLSHSFSLARDCRKSTRPDYYPVQPSYICIRYELPGYQDLYVTSALDGGVIVAHVDDAGMVDIALYASNWTAASRRLFISLGRMPQVVPTADVGLMRTFAKNIIDQGWVELAAAAKNGWVKRGSVNVLSLGVSMDDTGSKAELAALERARTATDSARHRRGADHSVGVSAREAWIRRAAEALRENLDGQYAEGFPTEPR